MATENYRLMNDSGTVNVALSVAKSEYNAYITTPAAQRVQEVWEINLQGADWAAVEAQRSLVHKALFEADRAIFRRRQSDMVWLEITRPDATIRRTLIYSGDLVLNRTGNPYCGEIVTAVMSFERHPRVEKGGVVTAPTPATITLDGTPFDITSWVTALGSEAPARIEQLTVMTDPVNPSPITGSALSTGWIGIQPKYPDGGVFSPFIDMGDTVPSISFSGGTAHAERGARVILQDVLAANLGAYRGRFRILLKLGRTAGPVGELSLVTLQAKMDSAETEKLPFAFGGDDPQTSSRYVDLGELNIPSVGPFDHALTSGNSNYRGLIIRLWAGCEDATVSLDIDKICLMPADNAVYLDDFYSDSIGSQTRIVEVRRGPDEDLFGYSSTAPISTAERIPTDEANVGVAGWDLPPEGGWLVCVMQAGSDLVPTFGGTHVDGVQRLLEMKGRARFYNL